MVLDLAVPHVGDCKHLLREGREATVVKATAVSSPGAPSCVLRYVFVIDARVGLSVRERVGGREGGREGEGGREREREGGREGGRENEIAC